MPTRDENEAFMTHGKAIFWGAVSFLLVVPVVHPSLIPLVGVPSHLLWWVHVLPIAMVTYRHGKLAGIGTTAASVILVVLGERSFGAGYGHPADWPTVASLSVALASTNLLVGGFALYARRSQRRYQVLFEAANTGIIRTDSRLGIEAANPAALQLLALDWEDVRGRSVTRLPGLAEMPAPSDLERTGWEGSLRLGENGASSEVHVLAAAVSHEDPEGYQILLVDRTSEVAQERELERQGRLATLGGALAGVAHELSNPLSVIKAWTGMASHPEMTRTELQEGFEIVRSQADRMEVLVSELLGFSRPREATESVRADAVVDRVVRLERMVRKDVRIESDIRWKGSVPVPGGKLEQVLVNLLTNGADAAPRGSGRVRVVLEAEGSEVIISVADNGPGIPADLKDCIFEPFVTTKPEGEGTGLGLPISRRLTRAMGGSLAVADAPAGGAVFTLRLPRARPEEGARRATEAVEETG